MKALLRRLTAGLSRSRRGIAGVRRIDSVGSFTRMNDAQLRARLDDTATAIDDVYRARADAADAIVREIFSGAIDLSQPTIAFEVEGKRVTYALARVERLGGIQEVPSELVGRRPRLADLPAQDGAAA